MSYPKRILLFIGILTGLYFAIMIVGGAIAGAMAGAIETGPEAKTIEAQAGAAFDVACRPVVFAFSCALSALISFGFRRSTWLVGGPVALFGYMQLSSVGTVPDAKPETAHLPAAVPAVTPVAAATPARARTPAVRRATLLSPVTVNLAYGKATLPKGTTVTVLSQNGSTARVVAPDGSTFSIPVTQIRP